MSDSITPRGPRGTTYNLLFVCTGNTCRSPMAEAIARGMLAERGWTHVDVRSAGVSAPEGAPASVHAVDIAHEHGLDLTQHASRAVTADLVDWADLILGMSPTHLQALRIMGVAERTALVTAFLEGDHADQPIADPFGGDQQQYRDAFTQLQDAVAAVLDRLEPILAP